MQQEQDDRTKVLRTHNLRQVANEKGGITRLAECLNRDKSQISQLVGKNPTQRVGERLAREFEEKLGLPKYWLDQDHQYEDELHEEGSLIPSDRYVWFPSLDLESSSGSGAIMLSRNRTKLIPLDIDYLKEIGAQKETACFVAVKDESMAPVINNGDKVFIDRGRVEIRNGGIYAVRLDGEIMIRRLFLESLQAVKLACDNPLEKSRFPDKILQANELDGRLVVIGQVLAKMGMIR